jgi:hypothetical protein
MPASRGRCLWRLLSCMASACFSDLASPSSAKLHIIETCARPSIPCIQPHRCPLQVWTYASRVAFVLSVTAKGQPIHEDIRLQRLQQLLLLRMSPDGNATVNTHKVRWTCCILLYQQLQVQCCVARQYTGGSVVIMPYSSGTLQSVTRMASKPVSDSRSAQNSNSLLCRCEARSTTTGGCTS